MPLHTILIVGGSWVILLILTIWYYRRTRDAAAERPASYKPDASGNGE